MGKGVKEEERRREERGRGEGAGGRAKGEIGSKVSGKKGVREIPRDGNWELCDGESRRSFSVSKHVSGQFDLSASEDDVQLRQRGDEMNCASYLLKI